MDPARELDTLDPIPSPASLRARADAVFEATSPYRGSGFRHHCKRLHRFAAKLLARERLAFDLDVAYVVAMWHDLGLVSERDQGHNYLQRSRALFHREVAGLDLRGTDPTVLDECLLYNHRVLPVPNLSREAECFRKAVIIEHSRGLVRFGLPRIEVDEVFAEYPRDDFDRVLLDFAWRTLRHEPITIVNGVFFGPGPHAPRSKLEGSPS